MNKKSVIICISVAAVLILGIAVAVFILYGSFEKSETSSKEYASNTFDASLMTSVPSDAVAVVLISNYQKASKLIPEGVAIPEGLEQDREFVISFHNSGSLVPLFIFKDTEGQLHVESSSKTLVDSSERHLQENTSILDNKDFSETLSRTSGRNCLIVANAWAPKFLEMFFGKTYSGYSGFIKEFSEYVGFDLAENSSKRISLIGQSTCGKSYGYYMNVLAGQGMAESKVGEVLPAGVSLVISIPVSDLAKYSNAYQKFLDNAHKLTSFDSSTISWAESMGVREVAYVRWKTMAGGDAEAIFYHAPKSSLKSAVVVENKDAGKISALFAPLMEVADDSYCTSSGEWVMTGSEADISDLADAYKEDQMYDNSTAAVFVTFARGGIAIDGIYAQENAPRRKSSATANVAIEIPAGPFSVKNCGTGKMNEFYQNENMYLCLRDEKGKGLWGVTFSDPICGRVQNVDYFNNGKIQFLFAYRSKLHLIDRLGRFVSGFPVELGKEVLLGPDVYDFSGNKAYCVMVLHSDNTIEMYNLKGNKPEKWQGISCEAKILGLPELKQADGKKYWIVRTAADDLAFDFYGGNPLTGKEAKNLIK